MKEAKKGVCLKCNMYFYVHEHHILPKSKFGKDGETVFLCPNCHTHFHEYSKKMTNDPFDVEEAQNIWQIWLSSVAITLSLLIGLLVCFW